MCPSIVSRTYSNISKDIKAHSEVFLTWLSITLVYKNSHALIFVLVLPDGETCLTILSTMTKYIYLVVFFRGNIIAVSEAHEIWSQLAQPVVVIYSIGEINYIPRAIKITIYHLIHL